MIDNCYVHKSSHHQGSTTSQGKTGPKVNRNLLQK